MRFLPIALLALCSVAAAQQQFVPFREKPGVKTFTGQLLVRPRQLDQLIAHNVDLDRAAVVRDRAVKRIRGNVVRYLAQLDLYVVRVPRGSNENRYALELLKSGDYEYAHPNWRCRPVTTPNDPLFSQQWHHQNIKSELAWSLWTGDPNFVTAIVDTGFKTNHQDLASLLLPGYNAQDRKTQSQGGLIEDTHGHGTHVSGCASARGNNGIGVSGVAWNHQILPIKVTNDPSGGASFDDMLNGVMWAADNGGNTINLSYSGVEDPSAGVVGTYCKSKGALLFWAAGNSFDNWTGFSYADTVVVGATQIADQVAGFSGHGRGVGIYAPGEGILSSTIDGAWGAATGTSMASPVASGVAALAWSANPSLTADDVQQIIYDTADPIVDPKVLNSGRVNVYEAVLAALAASPIDVPVTGVNALSGSYLAGGISDVDSPVLTDAYRLASTNRPGIGQISGTGVGFRIPNFANGVFNDNSTLARITARIQARANRAGVTGLLYAKNLSGEWKFLAAKPLSNGTYGDWTYRFSDFSPFVKNDGTIELQIRTVQPTRLSRAAYTVDISYADVSVARRRAPVTP